MQISIYQTNMSTNTKNSYSEFSTIERYSMSCQVSNTRIDNGVSYIETLTINVGVQITKTLSAHTDSEGYSNFALIYHEKLWIILGWTVTISPVIETQISSKENVKGEQTYSIFKSLIIERLTVLHNKDPPVIYL